MEEDILVHWNDEEEEEHRKYWETRAEEILEETLQEANLNYEHRLFDHAAIKEKYYNLTIRRFRRGVVSEICEVVNIGGGLCAPLKLTSGICTPLETLSDALEYIATGVNALYEAIKNAFVFNIIKKWYPIGLSDVSKTAAALVAEIASWFSFHTYIIHTSLSILTQWTALLLLLMLLQSALYLQHYLTQIDYDNNYISLNFRRYDRDCRHLGKPSVLPFKKNETSQYIFTSTLALSASEIKTSILAILQLLLNIIFYAVVVFFDYVLYYVVYLVHTYANIQIDFSGSMYINFQITGDGMLAKFLRSLVSGITLQDSYYTTYNVTECLPYPSYPDSNNHYLLLALNGGVIVTIILQSYCYRLKRALCGLFYQKREEERIIYLHNKILHHRKFKLQQMRSRLKDSNQARDAQQALAKLPLIGGLFGGKSPERSCLHCGISYKDTQHFYTCSRTSCYADYCEDCFNQMGRKCLLCSQKDDEPSWEELSEGEVDHSWVSKDTTDRVPLLQENQDQYSDEGQDNHRKPSKEGRNNHEKPSKEGQDNPTFSDVQQTSKNSKVSNMSEIIQGNPVLALGKTGSDLHKIPDPAHIVSLALKSPDEMGLSLESTSEGQSTDRSTKSSQHAQTKETASKSTQNDPNSTSTHQETAL